MYEENINYGYRQMLRERFYKSWLKRYAYYEITEFDIDQLVYKLYNLTADEILIVERT